jgi:hypothetical protein
MGDGASKRKPDKRVSTVREGSQGASSTFMLQHGLMLSAGLYLPANWYHYVRSEGRNIGVNFWYYLNPKFEGDCPESFDEPERFPLANCSWLGPGWDWQWHDETGICAQPASFRGLLL